MRNTLIIFAVFAVAFALLAGCAQPPAPVSVSNISDKDSHGCISSAGYSWCEAKQKCIISSEENCTSQPIAGNESNAIIENESGAHECDSSAGYSWDAIVNACVREGELNEAQKNASKIAVETVGYINGTAVISVEKLNCSGCFNVVLEKGGANIYVDISGWEASPPNCGTIKFVPIDLIPNGVPEIIFQDAYEACSDEGSFTGNYTYNNNSKTWWFEIIPNSPKAGCDPACVVFEENQSAEINWRCTGLNVPN